MRQITTMTIEFDMIRGGSDRPRIIDFLQEYADSGQAHSLLMRLILNKFQQLEIEDGEPCPNIILHLTHLDELLNAEQRLAETLVLYLVMTSHGYKLMPNHGRSRGHSRVRALREVVNECEEILISIGGIQNLNIRYEESEIEDMANLGDVDTIVDLLNQSPVPDIRVSHELSLALDMAKIKERMPLDEFLTLYQQFYAAFRAACDDVSGGATMDADFMRGFGDYRIMDISNAYTGGFTLTDSDGFTFTPNIPFKLSLSLDGFSKLDTLFSISMASMLLFVRTLMPAIVAFNDHMGYEAIKAISSSNITSGNIQHDISSIILDRAEEILTSTLRPLFGNPHRS